MSSNSEIELPPTGELRCLAEHGLHEGYATLVRAICSCSDAFTRPAVIKAMEESLDMPQREKFRAMVKEVMFAL